MLELHQRLQELADAATRDGATRGPAHAIRRGRRRRRRILGGIVSLLVVALAAGAAGVRNAAGPRLIVHGTTYGRFWILGTRPPRAGKGMCWSTGGAGPGGGGGIGTNGSATSPSRSIVASGSSGDTYGSVDGDVTKRAASVRVVFGDGRPPLEVAPLETGARFPVNFCIAYYPREGSSRGWLVTRVLALDPAGRVVAQCRTGPVPNDTCAEG